MKQAILKAIEGGWNKGKTFLQWTLEIYPNQIDFVCYDGGGDDDGYPTASFPKLVVCNTVEFWKCLGKAMGWGKVCRYDGSTTPKTHKDPNTTDGDGEYYSNCPKCGCDWLDKSEFDEGNVIDESVYHWHSLIDHLADEGNVDDFFNNLIK